jgi:hypothetical protein
MREHRDPTPPVSRPSQPTKSRGRTSGRSLRSASHGFTPSNSDPRRRYARSRDEHPRGEAQNLVSALRDRLNYFVRLAELRSERTDYWQLPSVKPECTSQFFLNRSRNLFTSFPTLSCSCNDREQGKEEPYLGQRSGSVMTTPDNPIAALS